MSPWPATTSPQFTCRPEHFSNIASALESVGHCIVADVLDTKSLALCSQYTTRLFQKNDAAYENQQMSDGEINAYYGSTYSFQSDPEGTHHLDLFMNAIEKSALLDLFTHLLKGDIAALHGPMLRGPNLKIPRMHLGFHCDGQVTEYAKRAFHSDGEYTLWTPFNDIDPHTPGLLLVSKKYAHYSENVKSLVAHKSISFLFNHNTMRKALFEEEAIEYQQQFEHHLNQIIQDFSTELYTPQLKLGSVILIHRDTYHTDFMHPNVTQPRYSADIRFIGDFDKTFNYINKERGYIYQRQFVRHRYDPYETPVTETPAETEPVATVTAPTKKTFFARAKAIFGRS